MAPVRGRSPALFALAMALPLLLAGWVQASHGPATVQRNCSQLLPEQWPAQADTPADQQLLLMSAKALADLPLVRGCLAGTGMGIPAPQRPLLERELRAVCLTILAQSSTATRAERRAAFSAWLAGSAAGVVHPYASCEALPALPGGLLVGWPINTVQQAYVDAASIPRSLSVQRATAVAGGAQHSLVLLADSTVAAVGRNNIDQLTVPAALTSHGGAVKVAAGDFHSVALMATGHVVSWGNNGAGQLGLDALLPKGGAIAIAAGCSHSLALLANGSIVAVGADTSGQVSGPMRMKERAVGIAAGCYHSLALLANGSVVGWGDNSQGQLNLWQQGDARVLRVAAGWYSSLLVAAPGNTVHLAGKGTDASSAKYSTNSDVNVVDIYGGEGHWVVLLSNGSLVARSYAQQRAISIPATVVQSSIAAVAVGNSHSLAVVRVAEGREQQAACLMEVFVDSSAHQPVLTSWPATLNPTALRNATLVQRLIAKVSSGCISLPADLRLADGTALTPSHIHSMCSEVSPNSAGLLAQLRTWVKGMPLRWPLQDSSPADALAMISSIRGLADLPLLQSCLGPQLFAEVTKPPARPLLERELRAVCTALHARSAGDATDRLEREAALGAWLAAGSASGVTQTLDGCPALPSGIILPWGVSAFGILYFKYAVVPPEFAAQPVVSASAGKFHSLSLLPNATVAGWGDDTDGQLSIPAVLAEQGTLAVAAGDLHSVALLSTGHVVSWGSNSDGQLRLDALLPEGGAIAIAAGCTHSLALLANGSVVGAGADADGQVSGPMQATAKTGGAVAISVNCEVSLVLFANGTLRGWGSNRLAQLNLLADGVQSDQVLLMASGADLTALVPLPDGRSIKIVSQFGLRTIEAPPETRIVQAEAGYFYWLALLSSGRVISLNIYGGDINSPPPISANVLQISAGYGHAIAIIHTPTGKAKQVSCLVRDIFFDAPNMQPLLDAWPARIDAAAVLSNATLIGRLVAAMSSGCINLESDIALLEDATLDASQVQELCSAVAAAGAASLQLQLEAWLRSTAGISSCPPPQPPSPPSPPSPVSRPPSDINLRLVLTGVSEASFAAAPSGALQRVVAAMLDVPVDAVVVRRIFAVQLPSPAGGGRRRMAQTGTALAAIITIKASPATQALSSQAVLGKLQQAIADGSLASELKGAGLDGAKPASVELVSVADAPDSSSDAGGSASSLSAALIAVTVLASVAIVAAGIISALILRRRPAKKPSPELSKDSVVQNGVETLTPDEPVALWLQGAAPAGGDGSSGQGAAVLADETRAGGSQPADGITASDSGGDGSAGNGSTGQVPLMLSTAASAAAAFAKTWATKSLGTFMPQLLAAGLQEYTTEQIEASIKVYGRHTLGIGAYGSVYRGRMRSEDVAIKLLSGTAAVSEGEFMKELQVHSTIRHEHVVTLRGYSVQLRALVFEYMQGGSLDKVLRSPDRAVRLHWRLRVRAVRDIASTLDYLHSMQPNAILHRDLKPSNVLLDQHLTAKVADVGLASMVPNLSSGHPSISVAALSASVRGTLEFIDPEFLDSGRYDRRSDVYSFGLIMCQLLTGSHSSTIQSGPGIFTRIHRLVQSAVEEADLGNTGLFAAIIDARSSLMAGEDKTEEAWPLEQARAFGKLAVRCASFNRSDRPLMDEVVAELHRLLALAGGGVMYGSDCGFSNPHGQPETPSRATEANNDSAVGGRSATTTIRTSLEEAAEAAARAALASAPGPSSGATPSQDHAANDEVGRIVEPPSDAEGSGGQPSTRDAQALAAAELILKSPFAMD